MIYTCRHCGNTSLSRPRRCIICGSRLVTHRRLGRFHQLTEHIFYEILDSCDVYSGAFRCSSSSSSPQKVMRRAGAKLKSRLTRRQIGLLVSLSVSLGLSLLISFLLL